MISPPDGYLKTFVFNTLVRKILFAVITLLLVSAAVLFYLGHSSGIRLLEELGHARARAVTEIGIMVIERGMINNDSAQIHHGLKSMINSGKVLDASLIAPDGRIVDSGDTTELRSHLPIELFTPVTGRKGMKFMPEMTDDDASETHLTPLFNKTACVGCHGDDGDILGYFAVKVDLQDLYDIAAEHRTLNITSAILIFSGLGLVIFLSLMMLVIRPLKLLQVYIDRVEKGIPRLQRGKPIELPKYRLTLGNDEISVLARSFNRLVDRLNAAYREIVELHEGELEKADHLATTGEMAASIAHEIKNPVAGVRAALQVFDSEMDADDPRKEIIDEMIVQLDRINTALKDLLSYARPAPPAFEDIHVHEIIEKTWSLLHPQLHGKSIRVEEKLHAPSDLITADPKLIQQVLWNIMLNALQAMDGEGRLTIATCHSDSHLEVTISDTGKGIPEENLKRIFRPFFTTKHKGTGLGMAISQRIIEQHKGGIVVKSKPGEGTTIVINFPLSQDQS